MLSLFELRIESPLRVTGIEGQSTELYIIQFLEWQGLWVWGIRYWDMEMIHELWILLCVMPSGIDTSLYRFV